MANRDLLAAPIDRAYRAGGLNSPQRQQCVRIALPEPIDMQLPASCFQLVDWDNLPITEHAGEAGIARWRTILIGDLRVRLVEYSAGYLADHWCDRGHILFVLDGELITALGDGRIFRLSSGMSYLVSDFGDAAHRSSTTTGARLFIVD